MRQLQSADWQGHVYFKNTSRSTHDHKPAYKKVTNFPTADTLSQLIVSTSSNIGQIDIDCSNCQISGQSSQEMNPENSLAPLLQSGDEDLFFEQLRTHLLAHL